MNLADGRKTRIEAFLYDDQGESYELQIDGVGVGVMFYRKRVPLTSDENSPSPAVPFPIDRTFIKLRMRSEILLKCNYIEWVGSNPK